MSEDRKEENDIDKFDIEYKEKIFELYKNNSAHFHKLFSILFGFTVIFLFIILLPYVSILEKNNYYEQQILDLSAEIDNHRIAIRAIIEAQNGTLLLSQALLVSPLYLNMGIGNITSEWLSMISYEMYENAKAIVGQINGHDGETKMKVEDNKTKSDNSLNRLTKSAKAVECEDNEKWLECKYRLLVKAQINTFNIIYKKYILAPLSGLDRSDGLKLDILENAIEEANKKTDEIMHMTIEENFKNINVTIERLVSDSIFEDRIITRTQIDTLARNIATNITNYYTPVFLQVNSSIEDELNYQQIKVNEIQQNEKQLIQNQTQLLKAKKELENRLNEIESPFGRIPINLDEAIAVFPFALGVGFFLSISYLSNAIRLRKIFHEWYRWKGLISSTLENKKVIDMTPLWIDPVSRKHNQLIKFCILVIPFVIFILSWYIIVNYFILNSVSSNDFNILNIIPSDNKANQFLFTLLYFFTLFLFVYSCIKIIKTIRSYQIRL